MESQIVFYSNNDSKVTINVTYLEETFWLSQKLIAQLFGVESNTINYHLKEIFKTGELIEVSTTRKIRVVQNEGGREINREIDYYSLDAIIAVGYRVNSKQATQFRIWATQSLKEFILKGFILNDELLKNGKPFGKGIYW